LAEACEGRGAQERDGESEGDGLHFKANCMKHDGEMLNAKTSRRSLNFVSSSERRSGSWILAECLARHQIPLAILQLPCDEQILT
jgi:hypothetical protein